MCVFLPLILFPMARDRDRVGVYVEVLDIWMLLLDILERERGPSNRPMCGPHCNNNGWMVLVPS